MPVDEETAGKTPDPRALDRFFPRALLQAIAGLCANPAIACTEPQELGSRAEEGRNLPLSTRRCCLQTSSPVRSMGSQPRLEGVIPDDFKDDPYVTQPMLSAENELQQKTLLSTP